MSNGPGTAVFGATADPTSRSGTILAGGTAQLLMAANSERRGWWLQNQSTGDLWVYAHDTVDASASQPALLIRAGEYYESPVGGASVRRMTIFGATTGQAFAAREW